MHFHAGLVSRAVRLLEEDLVGGGEGVVEAEHPLLRDRVGDGAGDRLRGALVGFLLRQSSPAEMAVEEPVRIILILKGGSWSLEIGKQCKGV